MNKKKQAQTQLSIPGIQIIRESDIVSKKEHGKYMIPKSWISEKQVIYMVQRTPAKYVLKRPGKGGQTWDYVPGWYIVKILNYVFAWNWDFEIIREGREQDHIFVLGKLTVKDDKGHSITKMQYGRAEAKYVRGTKTYLDYGNDLKSAATDSLKKCASEFGIASDIYGKMEMKSDANFETTKDEKSTLKGPNNEPIYLCSNCDNQIDKMVYDYSKKMFKRALCRECQKNSKK